MSRAAIALLLILPATAAAQRTRVMHLGDPRDGFTQYSGIPDSQRVVIRDAAAWRQYWTVIHRPFIPPPAMPEVDFDQEMILVAAMGTRPTGGFVIRIDSVTADSARVLVQVTKILPGRGCAVPAAVTQPVDLVRLPATALPVSFAEREERTDCSMGWPAQRLRLAGARRWRLAGASAAQRLRLAGARRSAPDRR
jgi:hypothetical protein